MARKRTTQEMLDERDRLMDVEEVAQYLNLHLMTCLLYTSDAADE